MRGIRHGLRRQNPYEYQIFPELPPCRHRRVVLPPDQDREVGDFKLTVLWEPVTADSNAITVAP